MAELNASKIPSSSLNINCSIDELQRRAAKLDYCTKEIISLTTGLNLLKNDTSEETNAAILNKIKIIQHKCEDKLKELSEIENRIKSSKKKEEPVPNINKSDQIRLYEKTLLSREIDFFREKLNGFQYELDADVAGPKVKQLVAEAIENQRHTIKEAKLDIDNVTAQVTAARADLKDLQDIENALRTKINERINSQSDESKLEKEKKIRAKAKALKAHNQKMSQFLYALVDKHFPPKTLQPKLVNMSLDDPNQYHQLPWKAGFDIGNSSESLIYQTWAPYLELLYNAHVIQFHPSDPSQVRLINYQLFDE